MWPILMDATAWESAGLSGTEIYSLKRWNIATDFIDISLRAVDLIARGLIKGTLTEFGVN